MKRVIVYVDGLNLFYGLRARGWKRYYWLNLWELAQQLLRPGQQLEKVRYFTARVRPDQRDPGREIRQKTYLEALETLPSVSIHEGFHMAKTRRCSVCGSAWKTFEEKMTDVNIAVQLLEDAQDDVFETAIVVSADSDLTGPVRAVRQRHPQKRVVVVFPPKRHSSQLKAEATVAFTVGRGVLGKSQLPDNIAKSDGFVLTKPTNWM